MTSPGRIAHHEAGHAVAAAVLGRRPGPVTIAPGRARWAGSAHFGRGPAVKPADVDRLDTSLPVPLWPAPVRRRLETSAIIAAAGYAAEELWSGDDTTGETAARAYVLADAPPLTRRERIAVTAERLTDRTDVEELAELGRLMYDAPEARGAWLWLVDEETRTIIAAHAGTVRRLATALEQHTNLSARAVRELLAAAR